MTEKTEEQIAKEREAVERMRGAKSAMEAALARISTLEQALGKACNALSSLKDHVGAGSYTYGGQTSVRSFIDDHVAAITKVLK